MSGPKRKGPSLPCPHQIVQICPHSLIAFLFEIPRHIERHATHISCCQSQVAGLPTQNVASAPTLSFPPPGERASFQLLIVSHRVVKPKRRRCGPCGTPPPHPRGRAAEGDGLAAAEVVRVIFDLIASPELYSRFSSRKSEGKAIHKIGSWTSPQWNSIVTQMPYAMVPFERLLWSYSTTNK